MNSLLFFSRNKYKLVEVRKILEGEKIDILSLNDFTKTIEPKESGNTFKKNAVIKSKFGFNKFNLPCFADDSGICISALNNKPGIMSKRFKDDSGGLEKTFKIIIDAAKKKNDFNAFFQTTIALTTKKNHTICFEGITEGKISLRPNGRHGFDYDPIFVPKGSNKTYAQMLPDEKNKISHRSIALNKMKSFLKLLLNKYVIKIDSSDAINIFERFVSSILSSPHPGRINDLTKLPLAFRF